MSQNRKKYNLKLFFGMLLAIILIIVGLALIFNKKLSNILITRNQTRAISSLTQKKVELNKTKKGMFNFKKVKKVNFGQIIKSQNQNGVHVIGAIAIPDVNLHLPILLGMSDTAMATGGGTMRNDQKMGHGNYPLAGHYMTSRGILFSPLENTKKNQLIYLTDMKKIYIYNIYMKKIVNPYAVYLVNNTKTPIVTLITCANGGKNRWAIRGKLIKISKATRNNLKVFDF